MLSSRIRLRFVDVHLVYTAYGNDAATQPTISILNRKKKDVTGLKTLNMTVWVQKHILMRTGWVTWCRKMYSERGNLTKGGYRKPPLHGKGG